MSELAVIYKQANDQVLKRYEDEPEDKWKVHAIFRFRLGEKTRRNEVAMFQFVKDIEAEVDELVKLTSVLENKSASPNKKEVEVSLEPVKPTTPP
jgi:hypothetical protein